jgi:hypothetical protein
MSTTSGESPSDRAPTGGIHEGCSRDTRCVIAQRPAHADHTFGRARHRSQGDRRDRGPHVDPHNDDVRRDQSEKARPHTGPNPVIWPIASKTRKF